MAHVNRVFIGQTQSIRLCSFLRKSAQIHDDRTLLVFSPSVQHRNFLSSGCYLELGLREEDRERF